LYNIDGEIVSNHGLSTEKVCEIIDKAGKVYEELLDDALKISEREKELLEVNKKLRSIKKKLDAIELKVKEEVYFTYREKYRNENQRKIAIEKKLRENEEYVKFLEEFEALSDKAEELKIEINKLKFIASVKKSYLEFLAKFF
jgi:hypothetical protein